ncbi:MAG: protein-glutamate O-methyltransferase CheR [Spirochaetaceae bacterium]|nr:protein-glutamate O-methyltransferase CheR [Spirochaetaceae bacterium]
MHISDDEFMQIVSFVTQKTGIIPRESHRKGIRLYVEKRLDAMKASITDYLNHVMTDSKELESLVNESTVNETYFFREEKQFALLRDKIFPEWIAKNGPKPVKIWCAACSSGEEVYSLLLLSRFCHLAADMTASDIDTSMLTLCAQGEYRERSKREGDGKIFHYLLEPFTEYNGGVYFSEEMKNLVTTKQINLAALDRTPVGVLPQMQNLIFIRNVFIYFSMELRASILKTIAEKCLAPGGYLFISMNEIASIDTGIIPDCLEKCSEGSVFYFRKK